MAPNLNPEQQAREWSSAMLGATDLEERVIWILVAGGLQASRPASRQAKKPMADKSMATGKARAAERPMAFRPPGHQAISPLA